MQGALLSAVDLNLLVALDALLTEGNVTRAAAKVGITQPAMSHALNRLRDLFDDPLLVRTPSGMLPTPRAEELGPSIRRALEEIERAIEKRPRFDPKTAAREFTFFMSDYMEYVLLPPLIHRLSREAPKITIRVRPPNEDFGKALESNRADFAMVVVHEAGAGVYRQRLFDDRFVCVVREGHPTVKRKLTLAMFTELDHVLIAPRGMRPGGFTDDALSARGLTRRVTVVVPHFLVAPLVVAESDLVLTVAERIARSFSRHLPLRVIAPPLDIPGFSVTLFWHERQHHDPGHVWLRGVLSEIAKAL